MTDKEIAMLKHELEVVKLENERIQCLLRLANEELASIRRVFGTRMIRTVMRVFTFFGNIKK